MKAEKEQRVGRIATAFGMSRTKRGYIVDEQMTFVLSNDEERNERIVSDFAKEHCCNVVEVWYREDIKWHEVKFHKIYNFYFTLGAETFEKLNIYGK